MHLSPLSPRHLLAPLILTLLTVGSARGQSVFAPGERWSWGGAAADNWIPGKVRFAANDSLVFAVAEFGERRFQVYDAHASTFATLGPRAEDVQSTDTIGAIDLAAARNGRRMVALTQRPTTDTAHRRTTISVYDPAAATFTPSWSHDLGFIGNANARVVMDRRGDTVHSAIWDGTNLHVERFDGDDGAALGALQLPGGGLVAMELSDDGERLAILTSTDLWVLFAALGDDLAVLLQVAQSTPASSLAYSGDGRTLLLGRQNLVEVWRDTGVWALESTRTGSPSDVPVRMGLSRDGETIGLAWWNSATGVSLRYECLSGPSRTLAWQHTEIGTPTGLQNLPQEVRVNPAGKRVLFGSWGQGGVEPELVLVDMDLAAAVWTVDLPGSVRGIDLDETGTRIAVSTKDSHANQFSTSGRVRLLDSGERDVQALSPADLGGTLRVVARRPAGLGSGATVFLLGPKLGSPVWLPGSGWLLVNRRQGRTFARATDAQGTAVLEAPLSFGAFALGQHFAVQAAFRGPAGSPLVLSWATVSFTLL